MKKVKGPAQAELGRGALQRWDGLEVRGTRLAKLDFQSAALIEFEKWKSIQHIIS